MTQSPRRRPKSADPDAEFPLDLATYVFHLFAVVSRHREARIDRSLAPLGLNVSRHRALSVVQMLQPCSMTQLAEFTAIDRTTLTRIVDQMVSAGLVERATPPEDRRQVLLTLTEQGGKTCRESLKAIYRLNRDLLVDLSETEQRTLAHAFQRLLVGLVDDEPLRSRLLLVEQSSARGRA